MYAALGGDKLTNDVLIFSRALSYQRQLSLTQTFDQSYITFENRDAIWKRHSALVRHGHVLLIATLGICIDLQ